MRVLVSTCNQYLYLLPGFIYLFNKYWLGKADVAILCYDIPDIKLPKNFEFFSMGKQPKKAWTNGIIKALEHYKDPYFVFVMEDMWPIRSISSSLIKSSEQMMEFVDKFDLSYYCPFDAPHEKYDERYLIMSQHAPYRASLQPAIWRREYFLKYLKNNETCWQFETNGDKRGKYDGAAIVSEKFIVYDDANIIVKGRVNLKKVHKIPKLDIVYMLNNNLLEDKVIKGIKLCDALLQEQEEVEQIF